MESEFVTNPFIAFAGIVLIPVFLWFIRLKLTKNLLLIGTLLFFVFSRGTLEAIGFNTSVLRLVLETLILWVFVKGVLVKKRKVKRIFPALIWLILFLIVAILSAVLHQMSLGNVVLFFRDYLFVFIFFYGVLNIALTKYEFERIKKLIIYLFVSQIVANIIKYLIVQGIIEPYVGTMAILGGSLTVIFALIGSSYALSIFLITKNKKYLLFVLGFIIFSLLGGKRATIVYFPLLFILLSYVYQKHFETFKIRGINKLFLFTFLTIGLIYVSVRLMPSLNIEKKVWGSFDIEYAMDYSERYVTAGGGAVSKVGRSEAPEYILTMLYNDNPYNLLLGYGTGHLVKSSFNTELLKSGSQQDLSEDLYGVGYAARTAFLQILLQTGILGVLFYFVFVYQIYRYCKKQIKQRLNNNEARSDYMFLVALFFIYGLDFFTYSITLSRLSVPSIVMFMFMAHRIKFK